MRRNNACEIGDDLSSREATERREGRKSAQCAGASRGLRHALLLGEMSQIEVARRAADLARLFNVAPRAVLVGVG